ncbi:Cytosolic sulfotransferase 14 [Hibiscus syriacus]|uniref:Sulfotransferase n=1 Tax=Hibiscus syriacus TaxID=106335 RepID=A0A6A2Z4A6_HIBSY|nr:cytosolic sulfotransferase 14-like [Hibiscus syriacus]KAE8686200.1 Cytosolic sulfotransferase 14 [Hibiscus syriacus]
MKREEELKKSQKGALDKFVFKKADSQETLNQSTGNLHIGNSENVNDEVNDPIDFNDVTGLVCDHISTTHNDQKHSNSIENSDERYEETLLKLPKAKGWMTEHLVHYQGVWLAPKPTLKGLMWIQDQFTPRPTDIFLATSPKTGTTWLKLQIFATVNRTHYCFSDHPLHTTSPHDCVPFLDTFIDGNHRSLQDLERLPSHDSSQPMSLSYEDLKNESFAVIKRLGEVIGYPFSLEEESEGVVEEILKLCSFENLSNLEVNKTSVLKFNRYIRFDNRHLIRKGEVGDGKNYLTEEMIQRLNAIIADKLHGSGLVLGN